MLDIAGTARNTQHLLDLLARLAAPGTTAVPTAELARGFGRFPVVGYVWYHNDFGAPRYVPYFHLHEGVDLFATAGTPAIACVDGVVSKLANGSIGGISFWLDGDDGITYYYGHLKAFAPGLVAGKRVRLGDVLGFVGDSGVAQGTYPHLHFEMHPGGGRPVSPKAVLDSWLNQAEVGAVNAYRRMIEFNALNRIGGARWQSIFDLLREPAAPVSALWPTALDPTGAALGLDIAFQQLAWSIDPGSFTPIGFDDPVAAAVAATMSQDGPVLAAPAGSFSFGTAGPTAIVGAG